MVTRVLTIAGSDSGGGAGIQADLKTIGVLGAHGMSAITAVTAQNTLGVLGIVALEPSFVRLQIEVVLDDIGADAVKTGMLANAAIIEAVAQVLDERRVSPLVVDPVMAAESGAGLLEGSAEAALLRQMVPLATIITPNAAEAARLLGMKVASVGDQRVAARRFVDGGAQAALIKGGHLVGPYAIDVLCVGGELHELSAPRIDAANTHGTGCILASAIAVHLGRGEPILGAVEKAKLFVTRAIAGGLAIGRGPGPANPFAA
jgi:hydroxymethylpyrimidine/phosphomethylpyrimidine kinase